MIYNVHSGAHKAGVYWGWSNIYIRRTLKVKDGLMMEDWIRILSS